MTVFDGKKETYVYIHKFFHFHIRRRVPTRKGTRNYEVARSPHSIFFLLFSAFVSVVKRRRDTGARAHVCVRMISSHIDSKYNRRRIKKNVYKTNSTTECERRHIKISKHYLLARRHRRRRRRRVPLQNICILLIIIIVIRYVVPYVQYRILCFALLPCPRHTVVAHLPSRLRSLLTVLPSSKIKRRAVVCTLNTHSVREKTTKKKKVYITITRVRTHRNK